MTQPIVIGGPGGRSRVLGFKDDVLGIVGATLIAAGIMGFLNATEGGIYLLGLLALPGLALMALGLRSRRTRLRAVQVWLRLREHHVVPVERLLRENGFEAAQLMTVIAAINRVAPEAYLLDHEHGVMIDSRLRGRAVVVERCEACGAPVHASVPVGDADSVRCPSCGSSVVTSNQALLERALAEVPPSADDESAHEQKQGAGPPAVLMIGCALLLVLGLPFVLAGLVVGMFLLFPMIGGVVGWTVATRSLAPQTHWEPGELVSYASMSTDAGWISDPDVHRPNPHGRRDA